MPSSRNPGQESHSQVVLSEAGSSQSGSRLPTYRTRATRETMSVQLRAGMDMLDFIRAACKDSDIRERDPMLSMFASVLQGDNFTLTSWEVEDNPAWRVYTGPNETTVKMCASSEELRGRIIPSTPAGSRPEWQADYRFWYTLSSGYFLLQHPGKLQGEDQTNTEQAVDFWKERSVHSELEATFKARNVVEVPVQPHFLAHEWAE